MQNPLPNWYETYGPSLGVRGSACSLLNQDIPLSPGGGPPDQSGSKTNEQQLDSAAKQQDDEQFIRSQLMVIQEAESFLH